MPAYVTTKDIDSRRTVADCQINRILQEAITYLEKEESAAGVKGSQSSRLIAMHLRAYADMIDEFASIIEITEEEDRIEEQEALKLRDKYHFQDELISTTE